MELRIGMDDTDSVHGMCTTYLAYLIAGGLRRRGVTFLQYPGLVRLNPNIPWKTRGNGAVSLHVETQDPVAVQQYVTDMVTRHSMNDANPGIVFLEGHDVPRDMVSLGRNALWNVVDVNDALRVARNSHVHTVQIGNGQGVVGAMAAVGHTFGDSTAELITYRRDDALGTPRSMDATSVMNMQDDTYPQTFASYDTDTSRVLMMPRGPDPVFYGLRGESPGMVRQAACMLAYDEPLHGHMIFRTNQGTGEHLNHILNKITFRPHASGMVRGIVRQPGVVTAGGHVWFSISAGYRDVVCWVYRPTGLSGVATKLAPGDEVMVGGGVRPGHGNHPDTLSVEILQVMRLAASVSYHNPRCGICNKSMKSQGRSQGYECVRCGNQFPYRIPVSMRRLVHVCQYLPKISAQRHLSRPAQRAGRFNRISFDNSIQWFSLY